MPVFLSISGLVIQGERQGIAAAEDVIHARVGILVKYRIRHVGRFGVRKIRDYKAGDDMFVELVTDAEIDIALGFDIGNGEIRIRKAKIS